ncbi:MAG TPA: heavy metal translocating P-type ATPase [Actinomycetota bacterium]|nr:heavy metal translocating P-type ATPase [Actinomycetota bacterium]
MRSMDRGLAALALAGLALGGLLHASGNDRAGDIAWAATTAAVLFPLTVKVVRDLAGGHTGVDLIALLAMGGSLALGEFLAGGVIALMMSGGEALESYAAGRARRELTSLLEKAPHSVRRYVDGDLVTAPIEEVEPGDLLLVPAGAVVPVDGAVKSTSAVLDESAITGEGIPVDHPQDSVVRSGAVNAGSAFDLMAIATAHDSTYAGIVRLVEEASASKAPFVRLADRYALFFLPATLFLAGGAWLLSGDATRALAVLVVATPCPLILAAPIAIVAGMSRAASRGIVVKTAGAFESLARTKVLYFDKTGTLTEGRPALSEVWSRSVDENEMLRLAASLDQVSSHVLAAALVQAARVRGLGLSLPTDVREVPGDGVVGLVEGRPVAVGRLDLLVGSGEPPDWAKQVRRRTALDGSTAVFVAVDGEPEGALILEDRIRPESPKVVRSLHEMGVEKIVMLTGDRADVAEIVASAIGVDRVLAERAPEEKVEAVAAETSSGIVVMVGDGINDAPALASADIGVAMGARGATASSEAADVVLVVDRLETLVEGIAVSRRARSIAVQSVVAGMALSLGGMLFAAAGLLSPVAGALFQEVIDVAVILNALRALSDGKRHGHEPGADVGRRFLDEHHELLPAIDDLKRVADHLDDPQRDLLSELRKVTAFLVDRLLPHEQAEDQEMYPLVAEALGGADPTGAMSRTHVEISHLIGLLRRMVAEIDPAGPTADEKQDLRRILYGLHAILLLHFAQEEEAYSVIPLPEEPRVPSGN